LKRFIRHNKDKVEPPARAGQFANGKPLMSINVTTAKSNREKVALRLPDESQQLLQQKGAPSQAKDALIKTVASDNKMSVVVVRGVEGLQARIQDWQALAEDAIEPNCFYEPSMLIPAVESFASNLDLHFAFVYAPDGLRPHGPKILCGFFPLELSRRYKKLPVSIFRFWKHAYCFLCTPLLKTDYERQALEAFFDWLESPESPAQLMECNSIGGDGAFHKLLVDELNKRARLSFLEGRYNRALFKPSTSEGISGRHKKELRRQQNRLAEEGLLEYAALENKAELEEWIREFLQLEASGWKGQMESAFASEEASRSFFETVVKEAFERKQLMMIALNLNGKPVAMKCNFLTGNGSFAFKIAFDERYSRYSPGVLLELENMRRVSAMPFVEWMDSCAVSKHFMINRLWKDRRSIETILLSTGKRPADFLVSALPILRWFKRKMARPVDQQ
jgi:hypothetical protein